MADYNSLGILGIDHVEFAVGDIEKASEIYLRMGFEKSAVRELKDRGLRSYLFTQNQIAIVVSQSLSKTDPVSRFVEAHGDGLYQLAYRCKDATTAFEAAIQRGAQMAEGPRTSTRDFGQVQSASIRSFGDVRIGFVTREGTLFGEGFEIPFRAQNAGVGLMSFDHVAINVEQGKLDEWAGFCESVFGLKNTRVSDLPTDQSGSYLKVMESPDGQMRWVLNESNGQPSIVQEFLDVNHGAGVQHICLSTEGIVPTVQALKKAGIPFWSAISPNYYTALPQRLPQLEESIGELESLSILANGNAKGYLLQIYSGNLVGPFLYEIIQRKGHDGYGEGNFSTVLQAMDAETPRL